MGFQLQVSQCEFNYDSFSFRELDQHSHTNNVECHPVMYSCYYLLANGKKFDFFY